MAVQPANQMQFFSMKSPAFKVFPYVKYGINKVCNPDQNNQTDELHALAVLGLQLCGVGMLGGIVKGSVQFALASGLLGGIFARCHQQTLLMKDLENILKSIKKNNMTLKKQLDDFKEQTDEKIASLKKCISSSKQNNKSLKNTVTDLRQELKILQGESTALRELIEQTQLTTEHLENLKMQEKQSLEQLETINRKLETVTELLQEEKGKLSAEVKKLSCEIDRLSYVKV